ncbi:hypothetical protein PAXRUDRAFT_831858 [Paxillus rubicundulus Ve08.2h10]|uniref:Secreted protein n=1 Tax=Paxillus rubicundulus Ve08.2h10 TaxID=930991 RepID=A0A0D0DBY1_9AGAM|nr:hypothetical protein PAXRUDRAFT_831858 [Paxillus rubicundulus Ve08.2h10]
MPWIVHARGFCVAWGACARCACAIRLTCVGAWVRALGRDMDGCVTPWLACSSVCLQDLRTTTEYAWTESYVEIEGKTWNHLDWNDSGVSKSRVPRSPRIHVRSK